MGKGKREWNMFFTPRRLRGGVRAQSGRGGWRVGDDVWRFATPQKFAGANFYPPRKRRRVELVVGRFPPSREWKKGREWKECQWAGDKKAFPFPRKRESPESLTVFWHRAPKQLEVREIPAFAGMEKGRAGMEAGGGNKKSVSGRRRGWLGRNPAGRAFWRGGIGWRHRRRRGRGRGGLL